jgi:hypothetical protein
MQNLNFWDKLTMVLMILGGLNLGIMGIFRFDVIGAVFGPMSVLTRICYVVVGLSAVYSIGLAGTLAKTGGIAGVRQAFAKHDEDDDR